MEGDARGLVQVFFDCKVNPRNKMDADVASVNARRGGIIRPRNSKREPARRASQPALRCNALPVAAGPDLNYAYVTVLNSGAGTYEQTFRIVTNTWHIKFPPRELLLTWRYSIGRPFVSHLPRSDCHLFRSFCCRRLIMKFGRMGSDLTRR